MSSQRGFADEKAYLYRDVKSKTILNIRKGFVPGMNVPGRV